MHSDRSARRCGSGRPERAGRRRQLPLRHRALHKHAADRAIRLERTEPARNSHAQIRAVGGRHDRNTFHPTATRDGRHRGQNGVIVAVSRAAALGLRNVLSGRRHDGGGRHRRRHHQEGRDLDPDRRRCRGRERCGQAAAAPDPERRNRGPGRAPQQPGPSGGLQRTGAGGSGPRPGEPAAQSHVLDFANIGQRSRRDRTAGRRRHSGARHPAVPLGNRTSTFPAGAVAGRPRDAAARRGSQTVLLPRGRRQRTHRTSRGRQIHRGIHGPTSPQTRPDRIAQQARPGARAGVLCRDHGRTRIDTPGGGELAGTPRAS